jgi:hypothetical protein
MTPEAIQLLKHAAHDGGYGQGKVYITSTHHGKQVKAGAYEANFGPEDHRGFVACKQLVDELVAAKYLEPKTIQPPSYFLYEVTAAGYKAAL